jgi:hypothetical protein
MLLETICIKLLPIFGFLLAASVTASLTLRQYFRQKEYEIIIDRYLNNSVDSVSNHFEDVFLSFDKGWAKCLSILKHFKTCHNAELDMNKEVYSHDFLKYDASAFHSVPFYRIRTLVGDDIYWEVYQSFIAFVDANIDFFENEICYVIKQYNENQDVRKRTSVDKIYDGFMPKLEEIREESYKYAPMLTELQKIGILLQIEKLSFNKIAKFKEHPEIKAGINRLKEIF